MQFIRLPKPIDIEESVLPELVADLGDTKSVQSINMMVLQQLRVTMLVSWVIECSKSEIPHRPTFRTYAHQASAIWHLSNHEWFRIIPDPGRQKRVTLSPESICTIPCQARASDVKMPKLRQHSANHGMPCFVNVFGTIRCTWDQADENPGALFRWVADIISNINSGEIHRPGMLIAQNIGHVSLVGCTNDVHNCRSRRELILCIQPPITGIHLAVESTALRVSEVHRSEIELCLKRKMCQEELDTLKNIHAV